ncbi:hypothetical protein [Azospirillum argentinense]
MDFSQKKLDETADFLRKKQYSNVSFIHMHWHVYEAILEMTAKFPSLFFH